MTLTSRPGLRLLAGITASAGLLALYARGGPFFVLGFVALVPWLLTLERASGPWAALRSGWLASIAFVLLVLGWFGVAIGAYVGIGALPGLLVALLAAPLLQPQWLAFALVRQAVPARHGAGVRALVAAAAWVATEWLWPKLLGDTLGHGLHPSALLRQAADLGGAAGLTFILLLCNEALACAWQRRRSGMRALARPLAVALTLPLALALYGALRLSTLAAQDTEATPLRVGMVQTAIVDYERLRREMGAYEVVRLVLDTHAEMSREAVARENVDALLWSETVYPTTFGHPKSEAGAELDDEILAMVSALGVPTILGTYDLDEAGEYNAAAFVEPQGGLLGFYRKSHPFPLTEYVPPWLDGPLLRRALPWAGTWTPGNGARVLPLRTADGRDIPVLPLICLDDVHPQLAIDGARLGAQAIVGMSNDSWFSEYPIGAELHLAVARFRSIETRLPQVRVTANGLSAAIDAGGEVTARAPMGERALLVGEIRVREPTPTLMTAWGDWVGRTAFTLLVLLASGMLLGRVLRRGVPAATALAEDGHLEAEGLTLAPAWRIVLTVLHAVACISLLWMGVALLAGHPAVNNTLSLLRMFAALTLAPLAAAWALRHAHAAVLRVDAGRITIVQRERSIDLPVRVVETASLWRLPLPTSGLRLQWRRDGQHDGSAAEGAFSARGAALDIAMDDPARLVEALRRQGASLPAAAPDTPAVAYASARAARRHLRIDHPLFKFILFALVPALPAFRLHQIIAYGGMFGEYHSFGLQAYLVALVLWWGSWVVYLAMAAAWLRLGIETVAWAGARIRPAGAHALRRRLETAGRILYFVGIPAWLLIRLLS